MKQWYKVIDVAQCHDCNNCFMADKDEFVDNDWPGYTAAQPRHGHRWVDILRRERGVYARNDVSYLPVPCQHCQNAPCMEASPRAPSTSREDGIVMIDLEKAKGTKRSSTPAPTARSGGTRKQTSPRSASSARTCSTTRPGRRTPPGARTSARPMR